MRDGFKKEGFMWDDYLNALSRAKSSRSSARHTVSEIDPPAGTEGLKQKFLSVLDASIRYCDTLSMAGNLQGWNYYWQSNEKGMVLYVIGLPASHDKSNISYRKIYRGDFFMISIVRRTLLLFLMIIFIATTPSFAMQMSEPVAIGVFIGAPYDPELLEVKNASYISSVGTHGKHHGVKNGGWARFGNGADALYVHFNRSKIKKITNSDSKVVGLGGLNIGTAFAMESWVSYIYRISTNQGITIYAVCDFSDWHTDWMILGYIGNGTFVKYIDTRSLTPKYFGESYTGGARRKFFFYGSYGINASKAPFEVYGGTIVMNMIVEDSNYGRQNVGQFHFTWDDAAQWFGVDYVQ